MQYKVFTLGACALFTGLLLAAPVYGQRGGPQAVQLPAGPGQAIVQANCTSCHGLNLITGSAGFTKAD